MEERGLEGRRNRGGVDPQADEPLHELGGINRGGSDRRGTSSWRRCCGQRGRGAGRAGAACMADWQRRRGRMG